MTEFYRDDLLTIHEGDNRAVLREMPAGSVHCVMTSPPYYGLRDYDVPPIIFGGDGSCEPSFGGPSEHVFGDDSIERADTWGTGKARWQHEKGTDSPINAEREPTVTRGAFCSRCDAWRGQMGLEPTPTLYIEHLVETMAEVRRVLHAEGTLWLNLGDSYAADRSGTAMPAETMAGGTGGHGDERAHRGRRKSEQPGDRLARHDGAPHRNARVIGLKHKDLIGIPWMAAFALRADGWYLRRDVIWAKPNPMPESVEDRPTSSHEYIFMLTKSEEYFYDRIAVLEPPSASTLAALERPLAEDKAYQHDTASRLSGGSVTTIRSANRVWSDPDARARLAAGRNRRSVWNIATRPYKGAHYAVFPQALVEPPVKASTSSKGACPECGAQWRRQVVPSQALDMSRPQSARAAELAEQGGLTDAHISAIRAGGLTDTGKNRETQQGRPAAGVQQLADEAKAVLGGYYREFLLVGDETVGWRPGCGHGWGGDPDDLDMIASPTSTSRDPQPQDHMPEDGQRPSGQRGNRVSDIETTTRRGLDRERVLGEGRRVITRFEQKAYSAQMRAWPPGVTAQALDDVAEWLGKTGIEVEPDEDDPTPKHPGETAFRHYLRTDRRGARAIPPRLWDRWVALSWLTPVEPPDFSGALVPVPSVVMDIYGGSGTVGLVAGSLGRRAVLIDINGEYLLQQMKRNAQMGLGLGI